LSGDRISQLAERPSFWTSGALVASLETPSSIFIRTSIRTHNRSRSPRFDTSSLWDNVGKGSRQIGSVT
jgi:hypothetical protein